MKKENHAVEERFYLRCGEILGIPTTYTPFPYEKKNRWNNRKPGNGRFEGLGTIRMFGSNCIHVSFRHPRVNKTFSSEEAVYEFLERMISQ